MALKKCYAGILQTRPDVGKGKLRADLNPNSFSKCNCHLWLQTRSYPLLRETEKNLNPHGWSCKCFGDKLALSPSFLPFPDSPLIAQWCGKGPPRGPLCHLRPWETLFHPTGALFSALPNVSPSFQILFWRPLLWEAVPTCAAGRAGNSRPTLVLLQSFLPCVTLCVSLLYNKTFSPARSLRSETGPYCWLIHSCWVKCLFWQVVRVQ